MCLCLKVSEGFVSLQVLYLKNLHPKVSEDDLAAVFGHFRARDGCPRVRVLIGRMRGQAFVEFDGKETQMQTLKFESEMNVHTGFTRAIAINVCSFSASNPGFCPRFCFCNFGEISSFSAKLCVRQNLR